MDFLDRGITVVCDDIREEARGKISYMGIYGSDIVIDAPAFPVTLPKLCIALHFVVAQEGPDRALEFWVSMPGDDESAPTHRLPLKLDQEARQQAMGNSVTDPLGIPILEIRAFIIMAPCVLKQEGFIRARIRENGQETKLGSLSVRLAPRS